MLCQPYFLPSSDCAYITAPPDKHDGQRAAQRTASASTRANFCGNRRGIGNENRKKNPVGLRANRIARATDILSGGRAFSSGKRDCGMAGLVDAEFGTA